MTAPAIPARDRVAFLRQLGVDLVPPETAVAAVNAGTGADLPCDAAGAVAEFGEQVEAFAAAFWSLDPVARRGRWEDLSGVVTDVSAAARLKALEPGLDAATTSHPDLLAENLAATARELFVPPPRERAVRRAVWLAEQTGRTADLAAAARALQADDPAVWDLDPRLFDRLASGVPLAAIPARQGPSFQERLAALRLRTKAGGDRFARLVQADYAWIFFVLVGVAFGAFQAAFKDRPATPAPQPSLPAPGRPYTPAPPYTFEQLEAFRAYEQHPRGPEPTGYTMYRLRNGTLRVEGGEPRFQDGTRKTPPPTTSEANGANPGRP